MSKRITLTCAKCRQEFERVPSKAARRKINYCSVACANAARAPAPREKPIKHIAAAHAAGEGLMTTLCGVARDQKNVIVMAAGLSNCASCKTIRMQRVRPPRMFGRAA